MTFTVTQPCNTTSGWSSFQTQTVGPIPPASYTDTPPHIQGPYDMALSGATVDDGVYYFGDTYAFSTSYGGTNGPRFPRSTGSYGYDGYSSPPASHWTILFYKGNFYDGVDPSLDVSAVATNCYFTCYLNKYYECPPTIYLGSGVPTSPYPGPSLETLDLLLTTTLPVASGDQYMEFAITPAQLQRCRDEGVWIGVSPTYFDSGLVLPAWPGLPIPPGGYYYGEGYTSPCGEAMIRTIGLKYDVPAVNTVWNFDTDAPEQAQNITAGSQYESFWANGTLPGIGIDVRWGWPMNPYTANYSPLPCKAQFVEWTGTVPWNTLDPDPPQFFQTSNITATAKYRKPPCADLTVTVDGAPGWIISDPSGISTYTTQTVEFPIGGTVTLNAYDQHTTFEKWTGDLVSSISPDTILIDVAKSVTGWFKYVNWGGAGGKGWTNVD